MKNAGENSYHNPIILCRKQLTTSLTFFRSSLAIGLDFYLQLTKEIDRKVPIKTIFGYLWDFLYVFSLFFVDSLSNFSFFPFITFSKSNTIDFFSLTPLTSFQFSQFSDIKYFITSFSPIMSVTTVDDACGGHNHIEKEMVLIMREREREGDTKE